MRSIPVDLTHDFHIGLDIAQIHLGQDIARQDFAVLAQKAHEVFQVIRRAHAHEEERPPLGPFPVKLPQRMQRILQRDLGLFHRTVVDGVFQTEADGRHRLHFATADFLHNISLIGRHVEKSAHHILQSLPAYFFHVLQLPVPCGRRPAPVLLNIDPIVAAETLQTGRIACADEFQLPLAFVTINFRCVHGLFRPKAVQRKETLLLPVVQDANRGLAHGGKILR